MTKEKFDLKYHGEKVAVHCDTEEKAKAFLSLAKSFGYKRRGGNDLEQVSYWGNYKEDTCYILYDTLVIYSSKSSYESLRYTIVEFELDEPNGYAIEDTPSPFKESFKIGDVVYDNFGVKAVVKRLFYELEYEDGHCFKKAHETLTHKKPLKKITKEQLADMGYEVEELK